MEKEADAAVETLALGVRGYVCEIFDAPETAWRLHQEDHLIQWRDDASLRVDRYDARNLLHDREAFRQRRRAAAAANGSTENQEEDAELDELRFGDLRRLRAVAQRDEKDEAEVSVEGRGEIEHLEEVEEEPFTLPSGWPDGIQVPTTRREFNVLCKTAHTTRGNSALEILMKTRLAGNAQFGFLDETHALHACYLYVRDQAPHEAPSAARPIIRLLGDEYQESDEEEDGERPSAAASSSRGDTVLSPHGPERQRSESRRQRSESRRRRGCSHSRSRSRQRRSRRRRRSRSASTERRRSRDRSRSRERRRRSRSASRPRR